MLRTELVKCRRKLNLLVLWSRFNDQAQPVCLVALSLPVVVLLEVTVGVDQVAASSAHTVHGGILFYFFFYPSPNSKLSNLISSSTCVSCSLRFACVLGNVLNSQSCFYFYSSASHCNERSECPHLSSPAGWFSFEKEL